MCDRIGAHGGMAYDMLNDAGVVMLTAPATDGQRKFKQFRQTHGPQTFET